MTNIRPETLQSWALEAQDLTLSDQRAEAIAKFIEPQANVANAALPLMAFDSEPGDFVRALLRVGRTYERECEWFKRHPPGI